MQFYKRYICRRDLYEFFSVKWTRAGGGTGWHELCTAETRLQRLRRPHDLPQLKKHPTPGTAPHDDSARQSRTHECLCSTMIIRTPRYREITLGEGRDDPPENHTLTDSLFQGIIKAFMKRLRVDTRNICLNPRRGIPCNPRRFIFEPSREDSATADLRTPGYYDEMRYGTVILQNVSTRKFGNSMRPRQAVEFVYVYENNSDERQDEIQ